MSRVPLPAVAAALAIAWSALPAGAAEPAQQTAEALVTSESGSALFKTYCASCHGVSAKGDGPLAEHLRSRPPDLTQLAKRSGGKFDAEDVQRVIDGRKPLKGHGGPDMPVWGDAFKRSGQGMSEDAVKTRIRSLTEFLESLQPK
jgi:mono/diheme cytochrome c family protein